MRLNVCARRLDVFQIYHAARGPAHAGSQVSMSISSEHVRGVGIKLAAAQFSGPTVLLVHLSAKHQLIHGTLFQP